jgi:hypothetical protein
MANWNNPTILSQYDVFVAEAKDRDVDSATMFSNPPTNPVVGMIRFNRTSKVLEEWNGSAWIVLVLGVTGGGTGAGSVGGIGGSLGLGTMAYQNSNNVAITGGYIYGFSYIYMNGVILPLAHNAYDLGRSDLYWRNAYVASAMVIPVGIDKYAVG